jgi:hypothetical protein
MAAFCCWCGQGVLRQRSFQSVANHSRETIGASDDCQMERAARFSTRVPGIHSALIQPCDPHIATGRDEGQRLGKSGIRCARGRSSLSGGHDEIHRLWSVPLLTSISMVDNELRSLSNVSWYIILSTSSCSNSSSPDISHIHFIRYTNVLPFLTGSQCHETGSGKTPDFLNPQKYDHETCNMHQFWTQT